MTANTIARRLLTDALCREIARRLRRDTSENPQQLSARKPRLARRAHD